MTSYFNSTIPLFPDSLPIESAISQLQLTSAVAPFIQTENHVVTFATSDPPGPGSDHNLLVNTPVVIDPNVGDVSAVNSIVFNSVTPIPVAGSLWLNSSNNHLMHGAVDLESSAAANVTSTSSPVTGDSLVRYDGVSGNFIETSSIISGTVNTQFYSPGGPIINATGIQYPNAIAPSAGVTLTFYQKSSIIGSFTGPWSTTVDNILVNYERIGNICHVTIDGLVSHVADGVDSVIAFATAAPVYARPVTSPRTGTLVVVDTGIFQVGSWYMDTLGMLTIIPNPDPTSLFTAPDPGFAALEDQATLTYSIV